MPYRTTAELPPAVKSRIKSAKGRRQWMHVWNSAYDKCINNGGTADRCESSAFAQANGVVKAEDGRPWDEDE